MYLCIFFLPNKEVYFNNKNQLIPILHRIVNYSILVKDMFILYCSLVAEMNEMKWIFIFGDIESDNFLFQIGKRSLVKPKNKTKMKFEAKNPASRRGSLK